MGQSLSQLYVHLTFSTINRKPLIQEVWEMKLHACFKSVLKRYDCPVLIINSVSDHVHILFGLSKDYTLTEIVTDLKTKSAKWAQTIGNIDKDFDWQDGYGAFSVSHFQIDVLTRFIENQKKHHDKLTYEEEVDEIMQQLGVVDYDSAYFWN